jgi:hypothetical protein
MKTPLIPLLVAAIVLGFPICGRTAESKRTAEYLLSSPAAFEGREVTLDVAAVKPVQWKSPLPELAFFHALTIDRYDHKPGGSLLVAVPAAQSAAFAKKYGTDFDGRLDSDSLKGLFLASGPRKTWVLDTSGQLTQLLAERRAALPEDAGHFPMKGAPGRPGRFHRP